MAKDDESKKRYMLPQNVTSRFELIRGTGLGVKEVVKIVFGFIIGVGIFMLLSIPTEPGEQKSIFGEVIGTVDVPIIPIFIRFIAALIPICIQVIRYATVGNGKTGGYLLKTVMAYYNEPKLYKYKKGSEF